MKKLSLLVVLLASVSAFALPSADEMSTSQLVGQTIMPRLYIGRHHVFKDAIEKGEVTGFFVKSEAGMFGASVTLKNQEKFLKKQRKLLTKTLKDIDKWVAKSPHKIPVLLAFDYEGGTVTSPMFMGLKQMPSNMLLAATQDPQLVRQMYAQQAAEIRRVGGNMALGPVTDVNSNPANPIIQTRSFGDNAAQVGKFASAAVEGLQFNGVPAVLKHFPGHGDTATDSHFTQPVTNLPEKELWDTHISAFEPAINDGVWGVMTNFVIYPQLDDKNSALFSHKIVTDLLRDKMGFRGLVLTDGLDMKGNGNKAVEDIVLDGYGAGNDVLLLTGSEVDYDKSVEYAQRAANIVEKELQQPQPAFSREQLVQSVQRILDLKDLVSNQPLAQTDEKEFSRVSRKVAEKGVTLVRDAQDFIGQFEKANEVCVVMFADGIFSKQVNNFAATLKQNGKKVRYVQTPRAPEADAAQRIYNCMKGADAVIVGTSSTSTTQPQQFEMVNDIFNAAKAHAQPVALLSLLNPYEIPSYSRAATVMALYGPTEEATAVAAEILLGLRQPRGVLPITLQENILLPFEKVQKRLVL